ncbi:anhydro-N-acetylmuramic acid kinase [Albibacterium bauzanense]|uniref:Anhydro-N-acetylmuramic acid kinase n=1 Tax=Albibacterium bauzanense TaxID=653929 RepID=A0A4R1LX83_9SPHI|nr:anhydro-N-acetylmuramic acid kinase [Albibacterium bauzanense]TCK83094.1 anhydro-N-acetylmuramic acid kinase [Albibacterium bauzanense]
MNNNILKLYNIANKESRLIVGLMSGTSLDGLDIVLCKVKGCSIQTQIEMLAFETIEYTISFRESIKAVFSKDTVDMKLLCVMNASIGIEHAHLVNAALAKWKIKAKDVDLIASHGQTVFHAPKTHNKTSNYPNSTLQIGDGDHIAVNTGIITVSDFRQKHVAAGGEGAPLVIYGDYLLFANSNENRVLLNIGGVSNFTFLPIGGQTNDLISTDIGPGNTLMNQYAQQYYSKPYDDGGAIAASGKVNDELLTALLDHPFFSYSFPKTTGPEDFNLSFLSNAQLKSNTITIDHVDIMATLCALTAKSIAQPIEAITAQHPDAKMYVSGGGCKNPTLLKMLSNYLPDIAIENTTALGIDPDAKEAILFSLLANETVAGAATTFPKMAGAPAVCFGKISFPD